MGVEYYWVANFKVGWWTVKGFYLGWLGRNMVIFPNFSLGLSIPKLITFDSFKSESIKFSMYHSGVQYYWVTNFEIGWWTVAGFYLSGNPFYLPI